MNRGILLVLGLALSFPAAAWEHTQIVWHPEDMPIEYWVAGGEDCPIADDAYCAGVAQLGWEAWTQTSCTDISAAYQGVGDNRPQVGSDGEFHISYGDPTNRLEPGVLATSVCESAQTRAFIQDGDIYEWARGCDIMFNDGVEFTTHTAVADGQCLNQYNMRDIMTHEIGHSLGMGHSCDEGERCDDQELLNAMMFWTADQCSNIEQLQDDDIEGITALYGPFATFDCSHELDPESGQSLAVGVVPFTLRCVVQSEVPEEITSSVWSWGDGTTIEGLRVEHAYTQPGTYTLTLEVNGDREECGEEGWDYTYREVGFVRACGLPDAAFEIEQIENGRYQLYNDTDLSVFGCVNNIEWQVFRGEGTDGELVTTVSSWEPQITLPDEGTYTIVQNVGGPAGTSASTLSFQSTGTSGCSTTGGSLLGLFALLPLAFTRRTSGSEQP